MSEPSYYDDLDTALTELIRVARGPRLSSVMAASVEDDVDRHLMPLLGLIVDRGPLRASDLQGLIAVEQSTLSRQLASLVERGLVVRDDDPSDRRAVLLTASPRARSAVLAARTAWRLTLAELMDAWDPSERDDFLRGMTRLSDDLSRHVGEPDFAG
jgi:DNA-binding MarR family transcriptional regulator